MTVFTTLSELQCASTWTGIVTSTSASNIKSANSRLGIGANGSSSEDASYIRTRTFNAASDFWTHWVFRSTASFFAGVQIGLKWFAGGTQRLALRRNSNETVSALKWNGASWEVLGTSTGTTALGSESGVYDFDCYIRLGNPGRITLYQNGVPVLGLTNINLTWSGVSGLDQVQFGNFQSSGSHQSYFSEIIVAAWNTMGSKLVTRTPNGAGHYSEWTGAGFGSVDEIGNTDGLVMTSGTVNQRFSVTHTSFPALASGESIPLVKASARIGRDSEGPQSFNFFLRTASADYDADDRPLSFGGNISAETWDMNPNGNIAWTVTDLNAAQMGVRSRA